MPRRNPTLSSILMSIMLLGLTACSSKSLYEAIQQNRLQACEEIPIAQQASCKAQYQTDYDTYERQRNSQGAL